jgi:hypothetical protein
MKKNGGANGSRFVQRRQQGSLSPEVKNAIAEEVRMQIDRERAEGRFRERGGGDLLG